MGKITRALSDLGGVIVSVIDATSIVSKAEEIHKTSAVVTAALGRLLTAGALMGNMQKNKEDKVTLRVGGDGPLKQLLVVGDYYGNVKGYVTNPVVEIPFNAVGKLDVGGAVGQGILTVILDTGGKEPHVGQVSLVSGEIAEDITAYYAQSQQTPTVCSLGVLVNPDLSVKYAGGFLLQLLPGTTEEEITQIEKNLANLPSITQLMCQGKTNIDIINLLLEGFSPSILDETSVEYLCDCSVERVERALRSLGKEELQRLQEEQEMTEIHCDFCQKNYRYNQEELNQLIP